MAAFKHVLWSFTRGSKILARSFSNSEKPVGFIGLGNMGLPMARNLLNSGSSIVVYDKMPEPVEAIVKEGATAVGSPQEVAQAAQCIVTMVPESAHVREVYTGNEGIFHSVQRDTLLIDTSTIDPDVAIEMAQLATEKGAKYIEAPVSGGVLAAANKGLTFMVGGDEGAYQRAIPLLEQMGKAMYYCGPSGTGQGAKICNNLMLAISMIGASEVLNLAQNMGLDPKLCTKILSTSSGRCWSIDTYNPCPGVLEGVPSSRNYEGGFGVSLMRKDLGLAQNVANQTKTSIPLGSMAFNIYNLLTQQGYAGKDFSSIFKFLQKKD